MKRLDHTYQVLYSELAQRTLDAAFSSDFSIEGRFVTQESGNRRYWYFDTAKEDGSGKHRRYVGPADDPDITRRVESFKDLKADHRSRRKLVSTLVREAYLPRPEPMAGAIVQALAEGGFFRLRGVLVGTVAYQAYSALLGVRLPETVLTTQTERCGLPRNFTPSRPPWAMKCPRCWSCSARWADATFREIPTPDGQPTIHRLHLPFRL